MFSLIRRIGDSFIFGLVGIWFVVNSQREYLRLIKFQLPYLALPIRLAVPRLANEKYLWRKMLDHNPDFVTVTDKIDAKDWIKAKGVDIAMPRTLWTGSNASELPDELWDEPMYLKAAHGCEMNIAVLERPQDIPAIKRQADAFLAKDHGSRRRQWAYSHVRRRLIAEQAVLREGGLIEIKCFTYGPVIEQFLVLRRGPPASAARWELMADGQFERSQRATTASDEVDTAPLPEVTDRALEIASEIGAHFDHVRIDFLTDGETLFLGEITVYHDAGRAYLQGHYVDAPANRSWDLRRSWFLTTPQKGWRAIYAAALLRALER